MPTLGFYDPAKRFVWGDLNPCSDCGSDMSHNPSKGQVKYHARGLCDRCYRIATKGLVGRKYIHFDEVGQTCSRCSTYQPFVMYTKKDRSRSGYSPWCRTCQKMYKFGMTKLEFDTLLDAQNHACAICDVKHMQDDKPLYVDHDHACCPGQGSCGQCVRGLLCDECNKALGHFKDSIESLKSALNYLGRSS